MEDRLPRKLAAILYADVAGYSRLTGADEEGTHRLLSTCLDAFTDAIQNHDGRVVHFAGDAILAEFPSVSQALACAVAVQQDLEARNAELPEERRLRFRVGVNLGEVIVDRDDIYGEGVNVAARLEGVAEPGGICISESVRSALGRRPPLDEFFDNGERKFKNIERPIQVWSWPRRLPTRRAESKPRIFVADFQGRGKSETHIGGDLGDELRAHLSRLTGLELAADRAGARYVVEGSIRLASGRSRVYARLVAVERSQQIWSDRYEENTDDAFDILDRCMPRLAMSIRRRVAADDSKRLAGRNMDELSFEELLSSAGTSFFTPTKAGWRGGGETAEHALELDPDNFMALAMAAAGLGLVEYLYDFGKPDDAALDLAFKRVNTALRLNNRSDMLHSTHAGLLLYGRRRYREAEAAAHRALEVNPDYNMGLWMLGAVQVFQGDYDRGAETAARAVNIDTQDPYVHLYSRVAAYGHLGAGQPGPALEWLHKADQLAPGVVPNLIGLAVACCLDGDAHGATGAVGRLMEEAPDFRVSAMHPLPYRDETAWACFVDALRGAGAPE